MGGKITANGRGSTMSYGWLSSHGPSHHWLGRHLYLWPGLPQMWVAARWWGLSVAVGFGLAAETWLLSVFVWDEMLGPLATRGLAVAVFAGWVIGVVTNRRWISRCRQEADADAGEDLFPGALAEYLQGNWFAAEQKCRDLIARNEEDLEARLLLATLLRHVGRTDEAGSELNTLAKIEGAGKWALEIAYERRLLIEAKDEVIEEAAETENSQPALIRRAA